MSHHHYVDQDLGETARYILHVERYLHRMHPSLKAHASKRLSYLYGNRYNVVDRANKYQLSYVSRNISARKSDRICKRQIA